MAIFKALTFDGVNSLDYGIYITGEAVYNAPERAVEMVNIPGKNGALALDQGRFENIEVTYHAGCFADSQADFADKVMQFRNALASRYTYKRLTDEYHPDEYRLGLYKSGLDVDAVRYGTAGEFNIVFDCKPQRFLTDGDRAISPTEWSDVQTATGELVTIESDGSLGVKSLEVSLSPIQDLNGYDKPWVGGAGKNKLPKGTSGTSSGITFSVQDDGRVKVTGTATATAFWGVQFTIPAGTYVLNGCPSGGGSSSYLMDIRNGVGGTGITGIGGDTGNGTTFTIASALTAYLNIRIASGYSAPSSGLMLSPMLRLASETDVAYAPYSNICPISGRTEVVTHRTGKNLLPPSPNDLSGIVYSDGYYNVNLTTTGATEKKLFGDWGIQNAVSLGLKEGDYCWKDTVVSVDGGAICHCFIRVSQHGTQSYERWEANSTRHIYDDDKFFIILYFGDANTSYKCRIGIQIELGSTATAYEPYQGNTYTTALGRTVYGGTLDVVSGELVVDRVIVTFNGASGEQWEYYSVAQGNLFRHTQSDRESGPLINKNVLCNRFEVVDSAVRANGTLSSPNAGGEKFFDFIYDDCNSVATWKTWLASNNLQVVYPLATPQTYQLTPQQIDLLLGTNHLWSDGEITVEYGVHPYYNPTPFDAKPLIKVTGTGTLGIGEYILTITGTASQTLYIDCETMEIYALEGTVPTGAPSLVSINKNDFPVLEPGTNYISVGSGITAVTITPRWWRI